MKARAKHVHVLASSLFFTNTMEKNSFPTSIQQAICRRMLRLSILSTLSVLIFFFVASRVFPYLTNNVKPPPHASSSISRCHSLGMQAGPPKYFHKRSQSDRFAHGTKPVLIQRGRIWTGSKNGTEIIQGDILLDKGLIKSVGHLRHAALQASYGNDLVVIDAKNAWITAGIVDIHSHLGDFSSPALDGAVDGDSPKGTIQPWLRSLDGLNTHDDAYPLSVAGGVTTALILPGSGNAIGTLIRVFTLSYCTDCRQVARPLSSNSVKPQTVPHHLCCLNPHITSIARSRIRICPQGGVT
jgi:hypothetical protein